MGRSSSGIRSTAPTSSATCSPRGTLQALARADADRGQADPAHQLLPSELAAGRGDRCPQESRQGDATGPQGRVFAKSVGFTRSRACNWSSTASPAGRIQRVQDPRPGPGRCRMARSVHLRPGENTIRVIARAGGSHWPSDPVNVTYLSREQDRGPAAHPRYRRGQVQARYRRPAATGNCVRPPRVPARSARRSPATAPACTTRSSREDPPRRGSQPATASWTSLDEFSRDDGPRTTWE